MGKQEDQVRLINIQQLLNKYVQQGFTLETLSKVTLIPSETLLRLVTESFVQENISDRELTYLFIFLTQLYDVSPQDSEFFHELISDLVRYFEVSYEAIANYLNISIAELKTFITSPDNIANRREYETRIMHLFTTFVRDIRFSIK